MHWQGVRQTRSLSSSESEYEGSPLRKKRPVSSQVWNLHTRVLHSARKGKKSEKETMGLEGFKPPPRIYARDELCISVRNLHTRGRRERNCVRGEDAPHRALRAPALKRHYRKRIAGIYICTWFGLTQGEGWKVGRLDGWNKEQDEEHEERDVDSEEQDVDSEENERRERRETGREWGESGMSYVRGIPNS
ncbi:hypothetical protein B0H13DRAFT_1909034 [Mycena leptocephala]|nr:hypothetical protein B0H13DRAFT_1909034 [Mycena leptocephala]